MYARRAITIEFFIPRIEIRLGVVEIVAVADIGITLHVCEQE